MDIDADAWPGVLKLPAKGDQLDVAGVDAPERYAALAGHELECLQERGLADAARSVDIEDAAPYLVERPAKHRQFVFAADEALALALALDLGETGGTLDKLYDFSGDSAHGRHFTRALPGLRGGVLPGLDVGGRPSAIVDRGPRMWLAIATTAGR